MKNVNFNSAIVSNFQNKLTFEERRKCYREHIFLHNILAVSERLKGTPLRMNFLSDEVKSIIAKISN